MKKQSINREYNFPDASLYSQCKERIQYIKRDQKEFESYAYTNGKIENFELLCKKFSDQPDDDELIGNQMEATNKKNEAKEKLKTAIRSVMTRVASKYNTRSGHYRKFGTVKMNDMSDPKLLLCGRRVVRVSNKLLDFLAETGLRQSHIDIIQQAASAFENAIHIQQDKISDRDIFVEKRIELGNELYRELVLVCNIGKDIWAENNKAKYENYTIYESNNDQKKARKQRLKEEEMTKKKN
ncbi:hypothetical protein [Aureispira anguillae]|uniref:Uncharacterized protein n=1 Tax=Aureispira anguillae TaxID=2864201 RepID=A0A915YEV6_9BACT|nr:hypothetical protein [Aureispira anguillae]BDS11833.1 hypothetical protein AsAng_0025470 [Aureispira anguillae]